MTPMTMTIEWFDHHKTVEGYRASTHFGTHRTSDGRGWHLTHLPSGRSVPYSRRATAKACLALAARLERLRCLKWDHLPAIFTLAQQIRILDVTAPITKAKGRS